MPITVVCPGCSAKLNAPDSAAGKKVKCPKPGCGEIIGIPAPAPAAFEVVENNPPPKPTPKKAVKAVVEDDPPPKKKRRDDDDEDEDERPKTKSKRRRDDDDEDEDERPWRRRNRDEYDDEDEGYGEPRPGQCPKCSSRRSTKVSFTWWGGLLGPAIFSMVRCNKCRAQYNRKTGKPIGALHIGLYTLVGAVIAVIILVLIALGNQ